MEEALLRKLARDHLLSLFPGARLDERAGKSTPRDELVALTNQRTILFKVEEEDGYRLAIRRSQPFDKVKSGRVTEKDVVTAFVEVLREIERGLSTNYMADLLSTFPRRVVVKTIASAGAQETLLSAIDQMALWATKQYEGRSITATFGFIPDVSGDSVTLKEICQNDFVGVMSNGFDTLLSFDFHGRLIDHESLDLTNAPPSFTPYRQGPIADWAANNRIAIALNRLGEILIFRDRKLVFLRRGGRWHFLTHEPILTQMGQPGSQEVRRAVYESCIDASFARTGACVGVVNSKHLSQWKDVATAEEDHLAKRLSPKTMAIARMVKGRRFQQLDRRLRQELLAVDGATLLDHKGTILVVGSILKIPGGSAGGGRLAAAKALSKLGLGVKVSQDGSIAGYHEGRDEPSFSVM